MVARRHRQRAQRPADGSADRAQRRRLRRCGGQRVQQPGGGPHRGRQHARRRRQPQRSPSGPRVRRRSVHRERRPALPESRRRSPRRSRAPSATSSATRSTGRTSGRWMRSSPSASARRADRAANCAWRSSISSTTPICRGVGASLPNALPTSSLTEANRVQPGQPFTSAAAGTFGRATSTVGTTVGIGTNRQIQLAFRLNF